MMNEAHDSSAPAGTVGNSPFSAQTSMRTGTSSLSPMTAERHARGIATKAALAASRAISPLRTDFLDDQFWQDLARRYNTRLPVWGVPITTTLIKRWLKKLGFTLAWYRDWQGEEDLTDFNKRNSRWPMRALAGLLLEEKEYQEART